MLTPNFPLNPSTRPERTAVFTGTFDPLTLGHLDIIGRGRQLFDRLVVAIGINPNKQSLFTIDERVDLARLVVAPYPNVTVEAFEELTVQFVRRIGARVILRGLRTLSDMEYEFGMTMTNQRLDPTIETVFLMADGEYSHISSSLIKQVARFGEETALARFVPPETIAPIMDKMRAAVEGLSQVTGQLSLMLDPPPSPTSSSSSTRPLESRFRR